MLCDVALHGLAAAADSGGRAVSPAPSQGEVTSPAKPRPDALQTAPSAASPAGSTAPAGDTLPPPVPCGAEKLVELQPDGMTEEDMLREVRLWSVGGRGGGGGIAPMSCAPAGRHSCSHFRRFPALVLLPLQYSVLPFRALGRTDKLAPNILHHIACCCLVVFAESARASPHRSSTSLTSSPPLPPPPPCGGRRCGARRSSMTRPAAALNSR